MRLTILFSSLSQWTVLSSMVRFSHSTETSADRPNLLARVILTASIRQVILTLKNHHSPLFTKFFSQACILWYSSYHTFHISFFTKPYKLMIQLFIHWVN